MSIDINSISLNGQLINNNTKVVNNEVDKTTIFEDFYNSAINLYKQTNNLQIEADKFQLDIAAGKSDDINGLMIAQQKAEIALQFTAQITNKVIESYREILRIQI